jgi:2Fe-2S ferredoxin
MDPQSIKKIPIKKAKTVLEAAVKSGFYIPHACEGMGACATCRIKIHSGQEKLSNPTLVEQERAQERGFLENERLACQVNAEKGILFETQFNKEYAELC